MCQPNAQGVRRFGTLTSFMCGLSRNSGKLDLLDSHGLAQTWYEIAYYMDYGRPFIYGTMIRVQKTKFFFA